MVQRERETKDVLADIETRALELERQKALLEQELGHCQEEVSSSGALFCVFNVCRELQSCTINRAHGSLFIDFYEPLTLYSGVFD